MVGHRIIIKVAVSMEKETDVIENMKNTRVHSPSEDI